MGIGCYERPNLFERQQAEDERQATIRREQDRQRDLERLAEENQRRIEEIRLRVEQFRLLTERLAYERRERERAQRNSCNCCFKVSFN